MKIVHEIKTISEIVNIRDEVHLNPAWQRGLVWSPSKQALLIDSILRGYDISMIFLRKIEPMASYNYEVVDGQQRLRSLWNYFDGELALPTDFDNVGKFDIGGKKYYDLPKTLRDQITGFRVVVAFVEDAQEPEVSRLFSRMQMGVRLNPAELRNASQTGLRHAIDGAARLHDFFKNSRIPPARYKYQDYLAHAISVCIHDARRDLKAQQLMDDYTHITESKVYAPVMADTDEILVFLDDVNTNTSRRIRQKWIFVDLFYLIYQNMSKITKLDPKAFSAVYSQFDQQRLEHNAEPENLLRGRPSNEHRDLYNYILAFKISGSERRNLKVRNEVLRRRFKSVLDV